MTDYLPASEAIKLSNIPASTFYRLVREGKLHKYLPTPVSKQGLYAREDIERIRSEYKRETRKNETGATDWITTADLGHFYDLEYSAYEEQTRDPSIIRKWFARNSYLCRILYNHTDRREIWGGINILPLEEETILKLLHQEILDSDLTPLDILTYEHPGMYTLYVTSVIIRPEKRAHFKLLLDSIFDFWCEQAPDRQIARIYARATTESGEMMVKKLFFSPLLHISDEAFMLDVRRPNPSRIVQNFQNCIRQHTQE